MKRLIRIIFWLILMGLFLVLSINIYTKKTSDQYIYTNIEDIPTKQVIIVLGAYVHNDNLSLVLEDHVNAAISLYELNKSDKLLLSGDHGRNDYDEVNSMRKYVLKESNISKENIFLDHAGFDTYDSMYRAKEVFNIESAIIVTQDFHINRAVYIARELGIDAVGYSVDQSKYKKILQYIWKTREYLSRVKAFVDVIVKSSPKYLGEIIPIDGDGRLSWDVFDE